MKKVFVLLLSLFLLFCLPGKAEASPLAIEEDFNSNSGLFTYNGKISPCLQ